MWATKINLKDEFNEFDIYFYKNKIKKIEETLATYWEIKNGE